MSVIRSAYDEWTKAINSRKARQDAELKTAITAAFTKNRALYGTRRLKKVLAKQGDNVSRRRIGLIMQEATLVCKTKPRFRVTTQIPNTISLSPLIS